MEREPLVALSGRVNFAVGIAGIQAPAEFGPTDGQTVLDTAGDKATDLEERVVLVASAAQAVLLHAGADLVDHLGGQPDHTEGVEYRQGVAASIKEATLALASAQAAIGATPKPTSLPLGSR